MYVCCIPTLGQQEQNFDCHGYFNCRHEVSDSGSFICARNFRKVHHCLYKTRQFSYLVAVRTCVTCLSMIHFNIVFHTPPPQVVSSLGFSKQQCIKFLFPYSYYIPRPSHPYLFISAPQYKTKQSRLKPLIAMHISRLLVQYDISPQCVFTCLVCFSQTQPLFP